MTTDTTRSDTRRTITLERTGTGAFVARNVRGGELRLDTAGGQEFTPVELLLVALAGCSAIDVDVVTSRRSEPTSFTVRADAEKVQEDGANILRDVKLSFAVTFPDDDAGAAARTVLPRAARVSHDRTCTVSRTVETGVPVEVRLE